jgi:transposase
LKALDTKIRDCYGYKESLYLASTFRNWQKEIENSVKYGINNEFVEGNNNKIKVLKRLSYGIKNFETLKNLIQLSIS